MWQGEGFMSIQIENPRVAQECTHLLSVQNLQLIRIIVADPLRLFRESVASMLNTEASFQVVGIASCGLEAIELSHELRPDIVLMDVTMPGVDGIEAMCRIKARLPATRVILLTTAADDDYIFDGIAAGANGYLFKDISTLGLISAIQAVYAGKQVTASNVANRVMQLLDKQSIDKCERDENNDGLTARERETITLIAKGMLAKEIARHLAISEKTVRNHISSIYRKLGIYDRAHIVIYALKKGLVKV
jgi:DNA-binding NarL/FixJ family response regulator